MTKCMMLVLSICIKCYHYKLIYNKKYHITRKTVKPTTVAFLPTSSKPPGISHCTGKWRIHFCEEILSGN